MLDQVQPLGLLALGGPLLCRELTLLESRGPSLRRSVHQPDRAGVAGPGDTEAPPPPSHGTDARAPPVTDSGGRLVPHRPGEFLIEQDARSSAVCPLAAKSRPGDACGRSARHDHIAVAGKAGRPVADAADGTGRGAACGGDGGHAGRVAERSRPSRIPPLAHQARHPRRLRHRQVVRACRFEDRVHAPYSLFIGND